MPGQGTQPEVPGGDPSLRAHPAITMLGQGLFITGLLIVYEMVGRKFLTGEVRLGTSLAWAEELAQYIVAWVTMIFIAFAAISDEHVSSSVLPRRVRELPVIRILIDWATVIAMAAVALIWLGPGSNMVFTDYQSGASSTSSLQAPYWLVHLCIPIGGLLLLGVVGWKVWARLKAQLRGSD